jgi:hypothetical protein
MIVTKNAFSAFTLMTGTFSLQMTLLVTSLYCIIRNPIHKFCELEFIIHEERSKIYCYLLVIIHVLLLVLNFFMEVMPRP